MQPIPLRSAAHNGSPQGTVNVETESATASAETGKAGRNARPFLFLRMLNYCPRNRYRIPRLNPLGVRPPLFNFTAVGVIVGGPANEGQNWYS
jgi:hypothetical protein